MDRVGVLPVVKMVADCLPKSAVKKTELGADVFWVSVGERAKVMVPCGCS